MKKSSLLCLALFLFGVVLFLVQLWGQPFSPETFSKLFLTDIVLFVAAFVIAFVIKEDKATQNLNKGNELD
jgi:hypothetical protein